MEGLDGLTHIFQRAIKRAGQTENMQVKTHKKMGLEKEKEGNGI